MFSDCHPSHITSNMVPLTVGQWFTNLAGRLKDPRATDLLTRPASDL
jgi:hypothetical protein